MSEKDSFLLEDEHRAAFYTFTLQNNKEYKEFASNITKKKIEVELFCYWNFQKVLDLINLSKSLMVKLEFTFSKDVAKFI